MFAKFRFGDLVYRIECESEEEARILEEQIQKKMFQIINNDYKVWVINLSVEINYWIADIKVIKKNDNYKESSKT